MLTYRVTNLKEKVNILDQCKSNIHSSSELDLNEIFDRQCRTKIILLFNFMVYLYQVVFQQYFLKKHYLF